MQTAKRWCVLAAWTPLLLSCIESAPQGGSTAADASTSAGTTRTPGLAGDAGEPDCVPGGLDRGEFSLPACQDAMPGLDTGSRDGGGPDAGGDADPSTPGAELTCPLDGLPVDCRDAPRVPGGSFPLGRCERGCSDAYADGSSSEVPAHDATVAPFQLDRFEVTVGRFRAFAEAYDGTPPAPGAGAHPLIADSGWRTEWNSELPADQGELLHWLTCPGIQNPSSWTAEVGDHENHAMNCVTWYEAFAFCAWEGKRLPTNAEWEFAAAGGEDNRLFPWGSELPTAEHANSRIGKDTGVSPAAWNAMQYKDVGSHGSGAGRWGHQDLAGNLAELVLDYFWTSVTGYATGSAACYNCAELKPDPERASQFRTLKGGNMHSRERALRSAARTPMELGLAKRNDGVGFRCARSVD